MEMRTVRTAGLVGGIATGALLLAGSAAQAADAEVTEAGDDLVMTTPEALGGLPVPAADAVTGAVPGLDAVSGAAGAVPVVGSVVPAPDAEAPAGDEAKDPSASADVKNGDVKTQTKTDADKVAEEPGSPVGDLLGNLGGGLPVPLPF